MSKLDFLCASQGKRGLSKASAACKEVQARRRNSAGPLSRPAPRFIAPLSPPTSSQRHRVPSPANRRASIDVTEKSLAKGAGSIHTERTITPRDECVCEAQIGLARPAQGPRRAANRYRARAIEPSGCVEITLLTQPRLQIVFRRWYGRLPPAAASARPWVVPEW